MKLSPCQRLKLDSSDDSIFYSIPRFSYHLDKAFRHRLQLLYREYLYPEDIVLDLMSSWVSHLPPDVRYKKVVGHGMNEDELKANTRLDDFWIQNFNQDQTFSIQDSQIDKILIVAGWQYLQYPENISKELSRIVKPNGLIIVSFTNRAFWSKSPNIWIDGDDEERLLYISNTLSSNNWMVEKTYLEHNPSNGLLKYFFGAKSDPFCSVIARNNKDI